MMIQDIITSKETEVKSIFGSLYEMAGKSVQNESLICVFSQF